MAFPLRLRISTGYLHLWAIRRCSSIHTPESGLTSRLQRTDKWKSESLTPLSSVTQHEIHQRKGASNAITHAPYSRGRTQTRRPTLSTLFTQPTAPIRSMTGAPLATASETICRITLVLTLVLPTGFLHSSHPDALRTTHDCVNQRQADACTRRRTHTRLLR